MGEALARMNETQAPAEYLCGLVRDFHERFTAKKQEKLRSAALLYLSMHGLDAPARFDVAEVYTDARHSARSTRIEYIENAF